MYALCSSYSAPPQYHVSPINGTIVVFLINVENFVSAIPLEEYTATVVTLIFSWAAMQRVSILCLISGEMNIRYWSPLSWGIIPIIIALGSLTTICGGINANF